MRIYTAFSETHKIFLPWFNTIKDVETNVDPVYFVLEQQCPTGEFASEGWNAATAQKLEKILGIFDDTTDTSDYFVFSDVDVQFFKPIYELGKKALSNHDIVFQNDYYGAQCTGFFYCKKNKNTKKLFQRALETNHLHRDDQTSVQSVLREFPEVKHALLPKEFFTYGMYYDHWHKQEHFFVPRNMVMHHANWVMGVNNKIELLKATRKNYEQQNFI